MAARFGSRALACAAVCAAVLPAAPAAAHEEIVVEPGDTIWTLAERHGVSRAEFLSENGLADPDRIVAGVTLVIPEGASGSADGAGAAAAGGSHRVEEGETLSHVAARYGVSITALSEANGLGDPGRIYHGFDLVVPSGAGGGASSGSASDGAAPAPAASSGGDVGVLLDQVAGSYGWNPALVRGLAMMESGWNNGVVSYAGAQGIMQVMPDTGTFAGEHLVGRDLDLSDPADNVEAGVAFLDYLYGITDGDVAMTLAGYYQGLGSVRRNGMYAETEHYIDTVMALRERYQ